MKAIILHDKFTEEEVGTVLLKKDADFSNIMNAWDKYQKEHNSILKEKPDIDEFVSQGNWELCEVLEVEFYQP